MERCDYYFTQEGKGTGFGNMAAFCFNFSLLMSLGWKMIQNLAYNIRTYNTETKTKS